MPQPHLSWSAMNIILCTGMPAPTTLEAMSPTACARGIGRDKTVTPPCFVRLLSGYTSCKAALAVCRVRDRYGNSTAAAPLPCRTAAPMPYLRRGLLVEQQAVGVAVGGGAQDALAAIGGQRQAWGSGRAGMR